MSSATEVTSLSADKENIQHIHLPHAMGKEIMENILDNSQPRTPLSSLSNGQPGLSHSAKALRKARYSFVSPASTPISPCTRRQQKGLLKSVSRGPTSAGHTRLDADQHIKQTPLNALVYKQVVTIIEDLKQEHENQLLEKTAYIEQLEQQLKLLSNNALQNNVQVNDEEDSSRELDDFVASFVDQIIKNAVATVQGEIGLSDVKYATRSAATSPIPFPPSSEECSSCTSHNNSPRSCDTDPLLMTPLKFTYTEGAAPSHHVNDCNSVPQMCLEKSYNASPVEVGLSKYPTDLITAATSPLDGGLLGTCDQAVNTSPGIHTTPLGVSKTIKSPSLLSALSHSVSTMMTPCFHRDADSMTTQTDSKSIATSPIAVVCTGTTSAETTMTPVKHKSVKVMTEKVESHVASTSPIVILGSRSDHERQLSKIQQEKNDYREMYYRAEQRLKVLETKLQALTELDDVFHKVKNSQMEMQTMLMLGFQKITKHANDHKEKQSKVHLMYEEQLKDKKYETDKILEELEEVKKARDEAEQKLEQHQCDYLAKEDELSLLSQQMVHLQTEQNNLLESLDSTKQLLQEKTEQCTLQTDRLMGKEKELQIEVGNLQSNIQILELEKTNLHRTLDSREEDLDTVTQERDKMAKLAGCQKVIIESLRKDIEQMTTLLERDDFMEQERAALHEELDEKRTALERCQQALSAATSDSSKLQEQIQQLSSKCADLQTELDETKARAHFMLFEQNSEMSSCVVAVAKLSDSLNQLQEEMLRCLQQQKSDNTLETAVSQPAESLATPEEEEPKRNMSCRRSFVCSVLGALHDPNDSKESNKMDVLKEEPKNEIEASTDHIPKVVIGAANSAFVRVQATSKSEDDEPLNLKQTSTLNTPHKNKLQCCEEDVDPSLSKQVDTVNSVVININDTFKQLHQSLKETIKILDIESKNVNEQLLLEKKINHSEQTSLKALLDQVTKREKRLREDLTKVKEQIGKKDAELAEAQSLIMDRTDKLEALAEEMSALKRQQKDYTKMERQYEEKRSEVDVMQQSVDEMLSQVQSQHGEAITAGVKELVWLRKQNAAMESQILQVQDEKENVLQKCAKRMDIFKTNWEKAEKEVRRLDDLVERLREALSYHAMSVYDCNRLQPLLKELGVRLKRRSEVSSSKRVSDV